MGKSRSKKRQRMCAACAQLSCAKDHWWCPHAAAVTEWCMELRSTTAAANEMGGNFDDPFKDAHLPEAPAERASVPAVSPDTAEDAAFADELRWRSSPNFLPCTGEVTDCLLWDQLAAAGRATGEPTVFPEVLVEHCSAIPCHSMLWRDVTLQFVLYFDIVFDLSHVLDLGGTL